MIHSPSFNSSNYVKLIHERLNRPLSLKECDFLLEYRRQFGDLHPDNLRLEQERFENSLKEVK